MEICSDKKSILMETMRDKWKGELFARTSDKLESEAANL